MQTSLVDRRWRVRAAALTTLVATLVVGGSSVGAPESAGAARLGSGQAAPADRLVWAEHSTGLRNLHLRSARADGTGIRTVYDHPRGFTMALVPDASGRRVAFVTCCRSDQPLLVVADTKGGPHRDPLREHPELEAADGLGWSPDGRSLAFTGIRQVGAARILSIWTIRLDGTHLREVLTLGDVLATDRPYPGATTVWTDEGILYTDGGELRLARDQTSSLVLSGVWSVQVSGDGGRLLLWRGGRKRHQLWTARPDGTGAREVARWRLDGTYHYRDASLDHDGSRLLAARFPSTYDSPPVWVAWDVAEGLGSAEPLPVSPDADVVAWH